MSPIPKTILVVDDSRMSRMMLRTLILARHPDWLVIESTNGDEALREAQECRFDLISIDYNMPGMSGVELIGKLRAAGVKAELAVLTANVQDAVRVKVEALGARFVKKPISEAVVAELLCVLER